MFFFLSNFLIILRTFHIFAKSFNYEKNKTDYIQYVATMKKTPKRVFFISLIPTIEGTIIKITSY